MIHVHLKKKIILYNTHKIPTSMQKTSFWDTWNLWVVIPFKNILLGPSVQLIEEAKAAALKVINAQNEEFWPILEVRSAIEGVFRKYGISISSDNSRSEIDTLMFEIWGGE